MHCKQRSYDSNLAVGKHAVMVHIIQTHDIQTEGDVLPWIFFSSQFTIHFYMLTYSGDPII